MGYELISIADGEAEIRLPLQEHHFNPGGIAHGGVIASLLDSVIGLALRTKIGQASHVTVQLDIHYLAAARGGVLTGRGTAVHTGKRMGYGEAHVYGDEGQLVATGAATFLVLEEPLRGLGDRPQGDA
jgi:acyl-CoA thioesterase